ncbi:hypothetical protein [Streptomyces monomycini]|nr:hypothetical protein [Streptomyces monomycini]
MNDEGHACRDGMAAMRNLQLCFFAGSGNLKAAALLGSQPEAEEGDIP